MMTSRKWLTSLALGLILALSLGFAAQVGPMEAVDVADYLPDEVILKLLRPADLPAVAADHQLDPVPIAQFGSRPIYRLRILDGALPPDKAAELLSDGRVLYAEPTYLEQTPEGRQRYSWARGGSADQYAGQWAASRLCLAKAHAVARGAGVTVAVLDTGVDPLHPALEGRLLPGYDFVNMDSDPSEEGVYGQNLGYGHGTHVAGLVAFVAPDALILPVRVLDPDGVGNIWVLAEALLYAVDPDGDPGTDDGADVINLSLSTFRESDLLGEILPEVTCGDDDDDDCPMPVQRGAVVVAAAGNSGDSVPQYPAAEGLDGLLAVAASTLTDRLALFSSYGDWVHVAAPGSSILSSVPGGGYGTWSGTSMAAPLVAGGAALVREVYPTLSAAEVTAHIMSTAIDIDEPVSFYRICPVAAVGLDPTSGCFSLMLPLVSR